MSSPWHPARVLLAALLMALCLGGSPGAERGLGELLERLLCGCGLCGESASATSAPGSSAPATSECCEDPSGARKAPGSHALASVPSQTLPRAAQSLEPDSDCCCSAAPSVPERGAEPSGAPPCADGAGLLRQILAEGAAASARTPSLCETALCTRAEPRAGLARAPQASAAPPGTALSGGQRLRLAGASTFVCVLCCVRL